MQNFINSLECIDYPVSYSKLEYQIKRLTQNEFLVIEILDILHQVHYLQKRDSTKSLILMIEKCYECFTGESNLLITDISTQINLISECLVNPKDEPSSKFSFRRSVTKKNLTKPLKRVGHLLRIAFHILEQQWLQKHELSAEHFRTILANISNQLLSTKVNNLKMNTKDIICRICEKPIPANQMVEHCNRCEQIAEGKKRMIEFNLELADISQQAFAEKRSMQIQQAFRKQRIHTQKKIETTKQSKFLRRSQTKEYGEELENEQEINNVNNVMSIIINYVEKVLRNQAEDTKQHLLVMNDLVNATEFIERQEARIIINRAHKCILERMKQAESLQQIEDDKTKEIPKLRFTKANSISFRLHKFQSSPQPRPQSKNTEPIPEEDASTPILKRRAFKINSSIFKVSNSDSPRSSNARTKTLIFSGSITDSPQELKQIESPSINDKKSSFSSNSSDELKQRCQLTIFENKKKTNFQSQEIIRTSSRVGEKKKSQFSKFKDEEQEQEQEQDQEEDSPNPLFQNDPTSIEVNDTSPLSQNVDKGYHSDSNIFSAPQQSQQKIGITDFEFIRCLGQGAYGKVYLAKKKGSGDLYAMKIIDCCQKNLELVMEQLKAERNIFEILNSNFVVKAIFSFVHESYLCFVQEYMVGGDLASILKTYVALDEIYVRHYMAEIILALEYLRNQQIVHRDLKPENILLDCQGHAKLADFGLSETGVNTRLRRSSNNYLTPPPFQQDIIELAPHSSLYIPTYNLPKSMSVIVKKSFQTKKIVGTPDYIAPEILQGTSINNFTSDYWSLGVIMYEMLCGIAPFNDDSVDKIFDNILGYRIEWPQIGEGEDCLSHTAYDLITKLLQPDHTKRIGNKSIDEIKQHPFFDGINWNQLLSKPGLIIPDLPDESNKASSDIVDQFLVKLSNTDSDSNKITQQLKAQLQNLERIDLLKQTSLNAANQFLSCINKKQNQLQKQIDSIQQFMNKIQ